MTNDEIDKFMKEVAKMIEAVGDDIVIPLPVPRPAKTEAEIVAALGNALAGVTDLEIRRLMTRLYGLEIPGPEGYKAYGPAWKAAGFGKVLFR